MRIYHSNSVTFARGKSDSKYLICIQESLIMHTNAKSSETVVNKKHTLKWVFFCSFQGVSDRK